MNIAKPPVSAGIKKVGNTYASPELSINFLRQ